MAREGEGFELETELHAAARQGDVEALKRLVAAEADVNKADVDLYTPLHRACDRKDAACVELLLQYKARLSLRFLFLQPCLCTPVLVSHRE